MEERNRNTGKKRRWKRRQGPASLFKRAARKKARLAILS